MHIAIAGNIGAGKTTLAQTLAEYYQWDVSYESVEDNPYLEDFYADMPRWAFHLQVYFLNNRFNQTISIQQQERPIIQDRTIYEDAYIFARTLEAQGYMTKRDHKNYLQIFESMVSFVQPPDLLIYLRADLPKLKERITQRGRGFESKIEDEYLLHLNQCYEEWITGYQEGKLLVVEINQKDLLNHPEDWKQFIQKIEQKLEIQ